MSKSYEIMALSTIDYPNDIAQVIFLRGCNMYCAYCYNTDFSSKYIQLKVEDIFPITEELGENMLTKNIVITGGEPCMQKELPELVKTLHHLGYSIKLDTNGQYPAVLESVLPYLAYVAIDVKTDIMHYENLGGSPMELVESLTILHESKVSYETRTTLVYPFVSIENLTMLIPLIMHSPIHYYQKPVLEDVLNPDFEMAPVSDEDVKIILDYTREFVKRVELR